LPTQRFADFMLDLRKSAGLSLEKAAMLIGVGIQELSDWEKGLSLPSELSAQRISQIYGIAESEWLEVLTAEKRSWT